MLLLRQFLMEWKLYSRERVSLFWAFAFPMRMLLGFGTIFRSGSGPSVALVVTQDAAAAPGGRDLLAALAKTPVKVAELPAGEAEARWRKGETSAQLDRAGDGFALRVNSYLAAQGQVAAQLVQEASLEAQLHREGQEPRLLPVRVESPGHAHAANYAAFLLPGLLGMNLMSMGLFGVGMVNVSYREKGKFRRLAVTPLPKWIFLLGQVLHRLTVTLLQSALMLVLGQFAFGIANQGSYVLLTLVMALGTACFMAMGFALASFARTVEGYSGISNAFFFPMMFLSGTFFPVSSFSPGLQFFAKILPLYYVIDGMNQVLLFNNIPRALGDLAVVLIGGVIIFVLAISLFKWRGE